MAAGHGPRVISPPGVSTLTCRIGQVVGRQFTSPSRLRQGQETGMFLWHQPTKLTGTRRVKVEPRPTSLTTLTSPPIMRPNWRVTVRPTPVPS